MTPHHFADETNAYIYYGIRELVRRGIDQIDAYNLVNLFNSKTQTKEYAQVVTVQVLNELIDLAPIIARDTPAEYRLLVDQVMQAAFRRDAFKKLRECEGLCLRGTDTESIQTRIYREVESLISSYQDMDMVVPLGQRVDELWAKICKGQSSENFVEFKFPELNHYVKLSRTDAIVIAAREKRGKSLFLMNCAVDLLKKGKRVLVIDTELDTQLYVMRLISHLTQIEFSRIRDGIYTEDEARKIAAATEWIKQQNFCHVYKPAIDEDQLVSTVKKYMNTYGLDVVILDYLKGNTAYFLDAYQNSAVLGKITDTLKNIIAGEMGLYVLTAVQATSSGAIADSQKIIRNCSALIYLERKTPQQIEADGGIEYGNMTLNVRANRNGMIMSEDEYISIYLDGNRCTFSSSKQPLRTEPY